LDDGPGVLPTEPSAAAESEDSGLPELEAAMAKKKMALLYSVIR
jgi:hypothetical protein